MGKFPEADAELMKLALCKKCGARNKKNAEKCRKCGAKAKQNFRAKKREIKVQK